MKRKRKRMDERCLIRLEKPPSEECLLGKNLYKQFHKPYCKCKRAEFQNEELLSCKHCKKLIVRCQWGLNSKEHNYCFWNWFEENNGSCSPTEIGRLLNITVQRVGQISKKSLIFLKQISVFKRT